MNMFKVARKFTVHFFAVHTQVFLIVLLFFSSDVCTVRSVLSHAPQAALSEMFKTPEILTDEFADLDKDALFLHP